MSSTIEYETVLDVDAEIVAEFDAWLHQHVAEMTALPGFVGADILIPDEHAATRRRVRYRLRDRDALERYLSEHAPRMRRQGIDRFGERFRVERVIGELSGAPAAQPACRNCGNALSGQYCAYCGQRASVRLITLWEFVRELVSDLFELDSRLWRTLRPLLFRPGRLTADYLAGRRTTYLPPLRLYVGLSLIFFLLASLAGGEPAFQVGTDAGGNVSNLQLERPADATSPPAAPGTADVGRVGAADDDLDIERPEDCRVKLDLGEAANWPGWLDKDNLQARLITACEKIVADHGASLSRALLGNIPAMMFFFLPMMALLMKPLFLFKRRYYVEHLLFLVHYHAFVFLALGILVVVDLIGELIPGVGIGHSVLFVITLIYVPIYLYKAMRRVYGHGRLLTLAKYFMLGIDYAVCLLLSFIGTFIYTALTL